MDPDPNAGRIETYRDTQGATETHIVLPPADRPAVEVRRDGVWHPGEMRAWRKEGDRWLANVTWSSEPGLTRIDTVDQDDVRQA